MTNVARANNYGQEVSLLHFKHFQGKIYDVVQRLVAANTEHPFIIKRGTANQGQQVSVTNTFRQLCILLHLNDLHDYRDQLKKYTRDGLECYICSEQDKSGRVCSHFSST